MTDTGISFKCGSKKSFRQVNVGINIEGGKKEQAMCIFGGSEWKIQQGQSDEMGACLVSSANGKSSMWLKGLGEGKD